MLAFCKSITCRQKFVLAELDLDDIGLAVDLKKALAHYSQGDQDQTGGDEREAVSAFRSAHIVARALFHDFDYAHVLGGTAADRIEILPAAADHVLTKARDDSKEGDKDFGKRFHDVVAALAKAFKLASGSPETSANAEEVAFFLAVRAALQKLDVKGGTGRNSSPHFAILN